MPLPRSSQMVLSILVLAAIIAIVWYALRGSPDAQLASTGSSEVTSPSGSNPGDVVFPVEVAVVRRGDLIKRLSTSGTIRAKREVEIIARVGGEIDSVSAFNGKYVRQGDLLVRLDDKEYRLAYEKASSLLLAAQIEYRTLSTSPFIGAEDTARIRQQLQEAIESLRVLEDRWQKREMSADEYNRRKRDFETDLGVFRAHRTDVVASKSGLTLARDALERAKLDLESTEIRAPFSGYVGDCDLATGMRIPIQKVLMKLVDVSRLYVDVEVLESEIGKLVVGRKAEVSVSAYPDQSFAGRVYTVNPIIDAKSKTVKVTIELTQTVAQTTPQWFDSAHHKSALGNPQSPSVSRLSSSVLRPGMFCAVRIETEILRDRLLVPKSALLVRDQRTLVFVVQNGMAKWQYVEVGEENNEYFEARSGIASGDTVIVGGHYTLAHDSKVVRGN